MKVDSINPHAIFFAPKDRFNVNTTKSSVERFVEGLQPYKGRLEHAEVT